MPWHQIDDLTLTATATTGVILGLRPANERRRYKVTPSLIGRAQTYNQHWTIFKKIITQSTYNWRYL